MTEQQPVDKEMPDELWFDISDKDNWVPYSGPWREECVRYVRAPSDPPEPIDLEGLKRELEKLWTDNLRKNGVVSSVSQAGFMLDHLHVTNRLMMGNEWKAIESAPRDGTQMLGVDEDGAYSVFRWSKHNHVPLYGWVRQIELYGEDVDGFDPIKYMPIPDTKAGGE